MLISSLCLKNTPKMLKWKKEKRTIQPIVLNYGCGLGTQIAWGVMSWFKDDQVHSLSIHVYETLETPSKYKFLFEDVVPPPLAHLLRWKQDNFRQSISDKSVVLLGTSWGTHCKFEEPFENLMGTHWKHTHTKKKKKAQNSPSPKQKNPEPLECMLHHFIGWVEFLFLYLFVMIFDIN